MSMFSGRGDEGFTDTLGGLRVAKNHPLIELIGELDELSAWIGLALSEEQEPAISEVLSSIQDELASMMSVLSSYKPGKLISKTTPFPNSNKIENWINTYERDIQVPASFTRSGSTRLGALYNLLRTITRRVERKAITFLPADFSLSDEMLSYLNRLSTLFFILWLLVDQR